LFPFFQVSAIDRLTLQGFKVKEPSAKIGGLKPFVPQHLLSVLDVFSPALFHVSAHCAV
jgi:hypothetical protein